MVIRQDLAGSDYGLLDEVTLAPRPDYWASVLWKRLMGPRVLTVKTGSSLVRAYAHCAPVGPGATLLEIHLGTESSVELSLPSPGRVYRVTAEALDSAQVSLNGHLLSLRDDGSLPPLDAVASPSLVLPPRSWAFVTLDDLPACH